MSKKTVRRLIMFTVGVPTIVLPIIYLSYLNFLIFHIEIVITSTIATIEMHSMFKKNFKASFPPFLLSIFGSFIICAGYFMNMGLATWGNIIAIYLFSFFMLFFKEFCSTFKGNFEKSLHSLSAGMFSLTYPWFFSIFFSRLVSLPNPEYSIGLFLLIVFLCDSTSWLFGKFLGKGNRGVFLVSPQKSVAGFIGGYLGAMFISIVFYYTLKMPALKLWQLTLITVFTTTAAMAGDLVESMLKRACNVKDSGWIVWGRGGILDSMDSLLFAVPVFYVTFKYFLNMNI